MAKRTKRIWLLPAICLLLGLALWLLLPGRGERGGVTELLSAPRNLAGEPERATRRERRIVTVYRGVPESLDELENYPWLRRADLSGWDNYEAIRRYAQRHPQVKLRYTVDLGEIAVSSDSESLLLPEGSYRPAVLLERLRYLPRLRSLELEGLDCSPEELAALREAYPALRVDYSVRLPGQLAASDTRSLDLSSLEPEQLDRAIRALRLLPALTEVRLTDEAGENRLSLQELSALQKALPGVLFKYRFALFGQELSTEDEAIAFVRVPIGNEGEEELRQALACLSRCRSFLLDDCGIDDEVLAALRADFPEAGLVWRVHFGYLSCLTDVKIIHLTFLLTDENAQVLRWCDRVEYLDLGHTRLTDIRFMADMPHLKYVILSFSPVSDLSPLANCGELEMLELFQCRQLSDLSPLAACGELRLLNVSDTGVEDLTPIYGLTKLERFHCIGNRHIPQEQQEELERRLPDCWITFRQTISNKVGWSFDDGEHEAQWYLEMSKVLRYRREDWFFGDYPED